MSRSVTASLFTVCLAFLTSVPAEAAEDDVILDGAEVTASEAEDGTFTARLSFINPTAEPISLPPPEVMTASCPAEWESDMLAPLETTSLTLVLDPGCFEEESKARAIMVDIDGTSGDRTVTVKRPPATVLDWTPLGVGLLFGSAAAVAVAVCGAWAVWRARETLRKSRAERENEFVVFRALLTGWLRGRSDRPFSVVDSLPNDDPYGWGSPINGLDAGWSFKDSWVSTASAGTAALVALLTSTDALTAVLGEAPKATLGVLTIAGLLTAIVLALANLTVKMFGDDISAVTVRGLVVSTALVAFATAFQIAALTQGVSTIATGRVVTWVTLVAGLLVGAIVIAYVLANLAHTVVKGVASQFPVIPADAPKEWAWKEDWQRALVAQALLKTYGKWLGPPPEPGAPDEIHTEVLPEHQISVTWLTSEMPQRASMP